MRHGRAITVAGASLGLLLTGAIHPTPASAEPECLTSSSDFDRDGAPDVAVGIPGGEGRNGQVRIRLSNEGTPFTTIVGGRPGFGSAVTSLSSYAEEGDDELCSMLVVGSPEESGQTNQTRTGAVYVYTWDATQRHFLRAAVIDAESVGGDGRRQSGARFGAALAAEQRPADESGPRPARLFVGAPGQDISGFDDTGQVTSFWIAGGVDLTVRDPEITRLGEPLTDEPTPKAALGSSLSVARGIVAMGMPGYPTRGLAGAGAVLVDRVDPGPDDPLPLVLSQFSSGVPGTAERGDRFGSSVHLVPDPASSGPTLLVGAPGEDVGSAADAGSVTVARLRAAPLELNGSARTVDQNSAGMAGSAEAGDQLGTAVSSMQYGTSVALLVGAPGEDVGSARDAGMVQTIGNGQGWTQNSRGVPGTAEAGDRLGASLGGAPATGANQPLIGLPGENTNTGAVLVGLPVMGRSVTYLNGSLVGGRYGFSVGP